MAHVGYYLIDEGLQELKKTAAVRASFMEWGKQFDGNFHCFSYLAPVFLISLSITGALSYLAFVDGLRIRVIVFIALVTMISASQLAIALVNWLATLLVPSKPLPKLDYSKGIPKGERTLVVVPTMISSEENVEDLAEALEVRFLANRDDNLNFALLTDFLDSSEEMMPNDAFLVQLMSEKNQ